MFDPPAAGRYYGGGEIFVYKRWTPLLRAAKRWGRPAAGGSNVYSIDAPPVQSTRRRRVAQYKDLI
ncbi:MAG: hypothetical protein RLZZ519_1266 [Bacteroidota bacterium]|jgi:hypothetical protein